MMEVFYIYSNKDYYGHIYGGSEDEVILPRGQKFMVVDVLQYEKSNDKKTHVLLELCQSVCSGKVTEFAKKVWNEQKSYRESNL